MERWSPTGAHETALWLYVACMAAGALLFMAWSRYPRGVPQYEYVIAIFIPIWSGLAYLAIVLGQGSIVIGGETVHVARYLDWLVTTPLLLLAVALTAMLRAEKRDMTVIAALIGADVVMVLSGLIADVTEREAVQWLWYAIGCVALLVIFFLVWGPLRQIAQKGGTDLEAVYIKVAGLLTVLWVGYPLGWVLGPSGLGVIGSAAETWWFVLLPIASKVGFSIYVLMLLRALMTPKPHPHPAVLKPSR